MKLGSSGQEVWSGGPWEKNIPRGRWGNGGGALNALGDRLDQIPFIWDLTAYQQQPNGSICMLRCCRSDDLVPVQDVGLSECKEVGGYDEGCFNAMGPT